MGVIEVYLDNKYGGELDDDDRWTRRVGEYHASETRSCPRHLYFKYTDPKPSDPSPYFELGNVFEDIYGRALASVHGERYVQQDVMCEIDLGDGITLVGESDWCVLREPFDGDDLGYKIDGNGNHYEIADGEARLLDEDAADPLVDTVIETKTTKDLSWMRGGAKIKHIYQLMTYLHATDSDGEVVYMQRNDLQEKSFDVNYSRSKWHDIVYRMHMHHENITTKRGESIPETDPIDDSGIFSGKVPGECKFCEYREECQTIGGSVWDG